nr:MAG TPA: hypothetical protein [Caudoviricetes sp.]
MIAVLRGTRKSMPAIRLLAGPRMPVSYTW